jgi:hypothetical protein
MSDTTAKLKEILELISPVLGEHRILIVLDDADTIQCATHPADPATAAELIMHIADMAATLGVGRGN